METNNLQPQPTQSKNWYDNKVLLIILFFVLPPLGIYGMLKHKTDNWKKVLYVLPAFFIVIFFGIGLYGVVTMDEYKTAMDYYNKKNYEKSYDYFKMVSPEDKNYNDAIAKINELKPIIDSIDAEKENQKIAESQREKDKNKEKEDEKLAKENENNPALLYPITQQKFINAIEQSMDEYDDASNELKKSAIRTKRGNLIKQSLGNTRNFIDWVVTVKQMETTSKGKAIFVVEIEETKIDLGTTNNELSDMFDNTLIEQSNPLYNVISELQKGDKILISGSFLPSDKNDYAQEYSLTEEGSMKSPDFSVRFSKISKK